MVMVNIRGFVQQRSVPEVALMALGIAFILGSLLWPATVRWQRERLLARESECKDHMICLWNRLEGLARQNDWTMEELAGEKGQLWIKQYVKVADSKNKQQWLDILKCPHDESDAETSYELMMRISSKNSGLPHGDNSRAVLLRERSFPGSHRWIIYRSGRDGKLCVERR